MSTESQRIQHIHKYLADKDIIKWKIRSDFTAGTPDAYYCGNIGSLWIEYKSIKSYPKKGIIIPKLSKLQSQWLNKQYYFEENVWVVVLGPERKHFIFHNPQLWENGIHIKQELCIGYTNLAKFILNEIHSPDPLKKLKKIKLKPSKNYELILNG
mgnify:CR=1 FL=1